MSLLLAILALLVGAIALRLWYNKIEVQVTIIPRDSKPAPRDNTTVTAATPPPQFSVHTDVTTKDRVLYDRIAASIEKNEKAPIPKPKRRPRDDVPDVMS